MAQLPTPTPATSTPAVGVRTIVVGVDGSLASLDAVRWAGDLAARLGARVVAVAAVTPFEDLLRTSVHIDPGDWRRSVRHRMHDDWTQPLREAGVDYEAKLVTGHPGNVLLAAAEAARADLIVVGVHQHVHLGGALSAHLTRHAPCPVVAVPPTPVVAAAETDADPVVAAAVPAIGADVLLA